MTRAEHQRGVTLPELLIALLVFAMISTAGVYALRLAVESREQLDNADRGLQDWRLARLIIRQDMAQIAPRIVRDEFGEAQAGAFLGGSAFRSRALVSGEVLLAGFVRRGWANPNAAAPRPTLQYVEYVLKGDAIVRRTRSYLDDARNQPRFDRVLFSDVFDVRLSFLSGEIGGALQWLDVWPGPGSRSFAPSAVKLEFSTRRSGPVEQLFWIGNVGELEGGVS